MDLYKLVVAMKLTKGGGGSDVSVDPLSVTENGTYTAEEGHAYSPVTVDVPTGGGSGFTLLKTENLGHVKSTTPTKTALGRAISVDGLDPYDVLLVLITSDKNVPHNLCGCATLIFLGSGGSEYESREEAVITESLLASEKLLFRTGTTAGGKKYSSRAVPNYGIHPDNLVLSNGVLTMDLYASRSSNITYDVDAEYTANIYGLKLYDLIP